MDINVLQVFNVFLMKCWRDESQWPSNYFLAPRNSTCCAQRVFLVFPHFCLLRLLFWQTLLESLLISFRPCFQSGGEPPTSISLCVAVRSSLALPVWSEGCCQETPTSQSWCLPPYSAGEQGGLAGTGLDTYQSRQLCALWQLSVLRGEVGEQRATLSPDSLSRIEISFESRAQTLWLLLIFRS